MRLYQYDDTIESAGWHYYAAPVTAEDENGNPVDYDHPGRAIFREVEPDYPHIVCWTVYRRDYRGGPTFVVSDWSTREEAEAEATRLESGETRR